MTQLVTIRVVTFVLSAVCGALCQQRPSVDSPQQLQLDDSSSIQLERQKMLTSNSFPDAPSSVQPPTQAERFPTVVTVVRSPLTLDASGVTVITEALAMGRPVVSSKACVMVILSLPSVAPDWRSEAIIEALAHV